MANRTAFVTTIDKVSGTAYPVPIPNYFGVHSVRNDVARAVLEADATATIQAAISDARASADASTVGGIVLLPPGIMRVTQLRLFENIILQGCGVATELRQRQGVNVSMLINDPTVQPQTSFLHHCQVRSLLLRKEAPAAGAARDSLGSAIELSCRAGERTRFEDLLIVGFPQSGIRLNRGGQPCVLRDIHVFGCGEYGVDLRRSSGDVWHMVSLDTIAGDQHGQALIHLYGGSPNVESFRIANVKSEANRCVLVCDALGGAAIELHNIGNYAMRSRPTEALIRVNSSHVQILGGLVRHGTHDGAPTPWLVDDVPIPRQVPYHPKRLRWEYDSAVGMVAG